MLRSIECARCWVASDVQTHEQASSTGGVVPAYSVVVPVYRNEGTLAALVERLDGLAEELAAPLEVVFVVDGSPDGRTCCSVASLPTRSASRRS